jgi:ATP-dependent Clp protease, protease subunit
MILSTMKGLKCPIHTICMGEVGASAAIIAAHGSPGLRTACPHTILSFEDLLDDPLITPGLRGSVAAILAQAAGRTVADALGWITGGLRFTAEQAIAHGIIDQVAAASPIAEPAEQTTASSEPRHQRQTRR